MIYFALLLLLLFSLLFLFRARRYNTIEALLLTVALTLPFDWSVLIGARARPTMNDAVTIFCLVVWSALLLRREGRFITNRRTLYWFTILATPLLWGGLTWVLHPHNESMVLGLWRMTRLFIIAVYILIGAQLAATTTHFQTRFWRWLLFGGLFNAFVGLVQNGSGGQYLHGFWTNGRYLGFLSPLPARQLLTRTGGSSLSGTQLVSRFEQASGTALHADWFAPFMVLLTCLWIGFALRAETRKESLWYSLGAVVCSLGLLASGNRSGFLGLFGGVAFIVMIRPIIAVKTTLLLGKLALITSLIALFLTPFFFFAEAASISNTPRSGLTRSINRIRTLFLEGQTDVASLNGRSRLWGFAWESVSESPQTFLLGTGADIERSDVWYGGNNDQTGLSIPVHNTYLFFLYYSGLPALLLFLVSYFLTFLGISQRTNAKGVVGKAAMGMQIGLVALAINSIGIDWISFASTFTAAVYFVGVSYILTVALPSQQAEVAPLPLKQ